VRPFFCWGSRSICPARNFTGRSGIYDRVGALETPGSTCRWPRGVSCHVVFPANRPARSQNDPTAKPGGVTTGAMFSRQLPQCVYLCFAFGAIPTTHIRAEAYEDDPESIFSRGSDK
jgi:hypothetical protein